MRSKYQPLVERVAKSDAPTLALSFAEMEAILGFRLSSTAMVDAPYWSGSAKVKPGGLLRERGWAGHLDRVHGGVVFARIEGRER